MVGKKDRLNKFSVCFNRFCMEAPGPAQHHPAQPPEQFTSNPPRLTVWLWHTKSQKMRTRQLQSNTHLHVSLTSLSPNLRSTRQSVLLSQCEDGVTDAWYTVAVSVSAWLDQKVAHQN